MTPAKGCHGCLGGVFQAITLLIERRGSEVSVAVVVVDGVSKTITALCPPGATLLSVSGASLRGSGPVTGLPLLLVVSRGGKLARAERLPPMPVVPEVLAHELEAYFALEE